MFEFSYFKIVEPVLNYLLLLVDVILSTGSKSGHFVQQVKKV